MSGSGSLSQHAIAISTSESPDMPVLGFSEEHLRDAMTEIARHLLALGARLVYGGDLRAHGFSELLFELVARHGSDGDGKSSVINFLAWPVHIQLNTTDLERKAAELADSAELVYLALDGKRLSPNERKALMQSKPSDAEWAAGLTSLRHVMRSTTQARIVLGGRVDQYKGVMPGIAEESLLSLQAKQPLFIIGGFGGCARDLSETLGLIKPWGISRPNWAGRSEFESFTAPDLNNGLTADENAILARTPHIDQAVTLILKGLLGLVGAGLTGFRS